MKVIHIAGLSGTGKTTFIRSLLPLLRERGPSAVVKHLGHHRFLLEPGKDTTVFLEEGAAASVGIDDDKSVLVIREQTLEKVLASLCNMGIMYTVVEGFKTRPLPKVLIGNLPEARNIVLANPRIDQVQDSLPRFPDFFTLDCLVEEMYADPEVNTVLSARVKHIVECPPPATQDEIYNHFLPIEKEIQRAAAAAPADVKVRVHMHKGFLFGGEDFIFLVAGAASPARAAGVFTTLYEHICRELTPGHHP